MGAKSGRMASEEAKVTGTRTSSIEDVHDNYDAAFKDAVSVFKDKALGFFGLSDDLLIGEPLRTEKKEVRVETEFSDLTFRLSDGRGFHAEEQVDLSKDDLLRFCGYHVDLVREYGCDFLTVVFVKNPVRDVVLDLSMLRFTPRVVDCSKIDGDEKLADLKEKLQRGEPLNELEVIYLPLFKSSQLSPEGLLRESALIIRQMRTKDEGQRLKMVALALMVSDKLVSKEILEDIWREIRMMKLKILEFAEEKGVEIGMAMGIDETLMVIKLAAQGKTAEQIAEASGIVLEKVEDILRKWEEIKA